jgi:hypothetical protein
MTKVRTPGLFDATEALYQLGDTAAGVLRFSSSGTLASTPWD